MTDLIIQDITRYLSKYMEGAIIAAGAFAIAKFVTSLIGMLVGKKRTYWKKWIKILISLPIDFAAVFYVFMVVVITFFSRMEGSTDVVNLELFSTFRPDMLSKKFIVENIVMFIPLGIFLRWYGLKKVWLGIPLIMASSTLIEMMQYLTGRGHAEVDDILTNTVGGTMGFIAMKLIFGMYYVVKKRRRK